MQYGSLAIGPGMSALNLGEPGEEGRLTHHLHTITPNDRTGRRVPTSLDGGHARPYGLSHTHTTLVLKPQAEMQRNRPMTINKPLKGKCMWFLTSRNGEKWLAEDATAGLCHSTRLAHRCRSLPGYMFVTNTHYQRLPTEPVSPFILLHYTAMQKVFKTAGRRGEMVRYPNGYKKGLVPGPTSSSILEQQEIKWTFLFHKSHSFQIKDSFNSYLFIHQ